MQKKFLTKLTAIATAGVFAVSMPSMTVLADEYEYPDGQNRIT